MVKKVYTQRYIEFDKHPIYGPIIRLHKTHTIPMIADWLSEHGIAMTDTELRKKADYLIERKMIKKSDMRLGRSGRKNRNARSIVTVGKKGVKEQSVRSKAARKAIGNVPRSRRR
ncbi:MAG: hypothetical protein CL944_03050 [Candidatus Diapherotrites archaeon]|mgnify:CR=1 FL=1|uniref:Uncharacterized protein n=1 Tax=Candidatus Iainarchaeum sp. TaxID=3101447 RepID=A0A2D6LQL8_9ARCH|nr:hypothetical protein [Candidatus Diapherotrites archaeon]|tara:strand:- start:2102 stop:2446 length:345 start_codon:yes stop_codon:yes gene_type:complete